MAIESATNILALNAAWPLGTDAKSEGDDHIRLIKSVLQAQFPSMGAGITGLGVMTLRFYNASATWTKPANLRYARVRGVGPGGAGGGVVAPAAAQAGAGAGGGAGGYSERLFQASELGATVAVTIGASGVGVTGANGTAGGTSSFGALMTMNGGGGGVIGLSGSISMNGNTGVGGTATGGTLIAGGSPGCPGFMQPTTVLAVGGNGGASVFGGAGRGGLNPSNGAVATGAGSGGGGASRAGAADGAGNGGAGGGSIIIVEEYS